MPLMRLNLALYRGLGPTIDSSGLRHKEGGLQLCTSSILKSFPVNGGKPCSCAMVQLGRIQGPSQTTAGLQAVILSVSSNS